MPGHPCHFIPSQLNLSRSFPVPIPCSQIAPSQCKHQKSHDFSPRYLHYAYRTLGCAYPLGGGPGGGPYPPPHPPVPTPLCCAPLMYAPPAYGIGPPAQPCCICGGGMGCVRRGRRGRRQRRMMQLRMERRSRPPTPAQMPITRFLLSWIQEPISLAVEEPLHWPCGGEGMLVCEIR